MIVRISRFRSRFLSNTNIVESRSDFFVRLSVYTKDEKKLM